jgi:protein gp37
MSDRSKIEWTDATWNPLRAKNPETGKLGHHCVKISPACTHCYAASMNKRLGTTLDYSSSSPAETFLDTEALQQPLHWKRPRKIFVCSMTDIALECYSDGQLDVIFSVMAATPWHTYQVLTKRIERLAAYFHGLRAAADAHAPQTKHGLFNPTQVLNLRMLAGSQVPGGILGRAFSAPWPLPNVQIGVTAENQKCAEERLPWLMQVPAAGRFLSCEPLLGPIDLRLGDSFGVPTAAEPCRELHWLLHWIIAGGESGQQARPMHPDWARSLRDQCQAAGVPFFFKQWGEWVPASESDDADSMLCRISMDGTRGNLVTLNSEQWKHASLMARVGKKKAGRLLDGREWNEFPTAAEVANA